MAFSTERNSIARIENEREEGVNLNDVMNVERAITPPLTHLSPALLATEVRTVQDIGPELVVERGVVNHQANSLNPSTVVGVSVTGIPLALKLPVALPAASDPNSRLGGKVQPLLPADQTGESDFGLPVSGLRAGVRAGGGDVAGVVVDGGDLNGGSANLTGMLPCVFSGPRNGLLAETGTHSYSPSLLYYTKSNGLVTHLGELSGSLNADEAHGNPQPSRQYTDGRFRDYWRGSAPLITSKSAQPEREDIVQSSEKFEGSYVEDVAEVQADIEVRSRYTDKSGYSLSAFVEGDATSGLASLPANFSQTVGALGVDPTDDDVLRCMQYLDDGDVPEDGRFFYVSPACYNAFMKIDKFTRQEFVGQADAEAAIHRAKVGMIYNAPVYKSSLANNSPSTANSAYNWVCHERGVALIMQREAVVNSDYVILETGWGVLVYSLYNFAERLIAPSTLGGGSSNDRFNVQLMSA